MSEADMILITGASGRVARRTAKLLSERGNSLRLMSRRPDLVPSLPGVDVVHGDFEEPATLDQPFAGITTALVVSGMALPGERAHTHRNAFEAAARAGVRHIVYLSLKGAAPDSLYPYCRDHYTSEQYLAKSGLPYTSLRIAFYVDMFLEKFDPQGVIRGPGGDGRGAFISREDAASAAAAVVANPPGAILDVTGPELLGIAEITQRLSAIVGRLLRYQEESAKETRDRLSRTDTPKWRQELEPRWFEAIAAGEQSPVTDVYRRLTGKDPQALEGYFSAFPNLLDTLRRH